MLGKEARFVFVSNYINHHQIPFCNAMYDLLEGDFAFLQMEPMEEERIRMGWQQDVKLPYVYYYEKDPGLCQRLIDECEVLVYGGVEETYLQHRLQTGGFTFRYSERLYKTGQWKAVTPRGLRQKYLDHTRYRRSQVYLLCAGAYVPSDYHIVRAYPDKMYCWGYFPETRQYEIQKLLEQKGYSAAQSSEEKLPYLLWAGRFIDWKHPQLALETAAYLKREGFRFHMDIIGGGPLQEEMERLLSELGLEDCVSLPGFLPPDRVREHMEQAHIYLLTSDRQEGWGAVANEAMNSGCALIANHMIGAAPYLIRQGYNGYVYRDGDKEQLFERVKYLLTAKEERQRVAENAYHTITQVWNAETAAKNLLALTDHLLSGRRGGIPAPELPLDFYPGASAPVISERKMYGLLTEEKRR